MEFIMVKESHLKECRLPSGKMIMVVAMEICEFNEITWTEAQGIYIYIYIN